jgi:hypothetical protein
MTPQPRRNQVYLIGQRLCRHHTHSGSLQQPANSWSREVDLLSSPAAVANSQHNGTNIGRKTWSHASSLRVSSIGFQKLPLNHFFTIIGTKNEKMDETMQIGYQTRKFMVHL